MLTSMARAAGSSNGCICMADILTSADLRRALVGKSVLLKDYGSAQLVADAIRAHGLESVIAGRHDGRAVTFAKAFELVFGERLTLKRTA